MILSNILFKAILFCALKDVKDVGTDVHQKYHQSEVSSGKSLNTLYPWLVNTALQTWTAPDVEALTAPTFPTILISQCSTHHFSYTNKKYFRLAPLHPQCIVYFTKHTMSVGSVK